MKVPHVNTLTGLKKESNFALFCLLSKVMKSTKLERHNSIRELLPLPEQDYHFNVA